MCSDFGANIKFLIGAKKKYKRINIGNLKTNISNKKINQNKNNKKKNSKIMIDKFFQLSNIKKTKINFSLNHGWKYSSNSKPFKIKSFWDPKKKIGVCADWFVGPRLESGWISAQDLYKKISK